MENSQGIELIFSPGFHCSSSCSNNLFCYCHFYENNFLLNKICLDLTDIREQNLEPYTGHVIDLADNEPQNYVDPLNEETDLESNSQRVTIAPIIDLYHAPSHWNKLRKLVLVDENVPQASSQPELSSNNNN